MSTICFTDENITVKDAINSLQGAIDGHETRAAIYNLAILALQEKYERDNQQVLTNADRIRAMSDEELAVTMMCPNEMGMAEIPCDHSDGKNCCECLLDWLRQSTKEE